MSCFDDILAGFRSLWVESGSHLFNVEWYSLSGYTNLNPPYDRQARVFVCTLSLPMDEDHTRFTMGDAITLPKEPASTREAFVHLCKQAGAALPPLFRDNLVDYCPPEAVGPASWWFAFLWHMHGGIPRWPDGRFRDMLFLRRPMLLSVDAIERCQLNTDSPLWPVRDTDDRPRLAAETEIDIDQMEKVAPALNKRSEVWISNAEAAKREKVTTASLKTYRNGGTQTNDKMFGIDKDGRIWRRSGTVRSHPWYLVRTLKSETS